jgi:cytochrome P450
LWKKHRKIINPAFSLNKLNKFVPIINDKARKLVKVFEGKTNDGSINVVRFLSALTLESLLQTSFGLEKDFINNPYDRFFTIVKKFDLNSEIRLETFILKSINF